MTALAIVPTTNASGKKDVTGAFLPEAEKWLEQMQDGEILRFNNTLPRIRRAKVVEEKLSKLDGGYDVVAFFCHGLTRSLQTGHTLQTAHRLAHTLISLVNTSPKIVLYACDTADNPGKEAPGGDGGFADRLRDEMWKLDSGFTAGGWIDAHVTTGHTTINPH